MYQNMLLTKKTSQDICKGIKMGLINELKLHTALSRFENARKIIFNDELKKNLKITIQCEQKNSIDTFFRCIHSTKLYNAYCSTFLKNKVIKGEIVTKKIVLTDETNIEQYIASFCPVDKDLYMLNVIIYDPNNTAFNLYGDKLTLL